MLQWHFRHSMIRAFAVCHRSISHQTNFSPLHFRHHRHERMCTTFYNVLSCLNRSATPARKPGSVHKHNSDGISECGELPFLVRQFNGIGKYSAAMRPRERLPSVAARPKHTLAFINFLDPFARVARKIVASFLLRLEKICYDYFSK